jgi:hypothetical protein
MARNRDSLQRRRPRREPKPRFLIVCEGTVTEPSYFRNLCHAERSLVKLQIERDATPKTIVERAVALKEQAERDAKKRADENLKYDEVWCVFDVDEHLLIAEAKEQAQANEVEVAISNPCFELWALLHFQDQSAHIDGAKVQRLCRRHMPGYEKKLDYEILHARYADAHRRAGELQKRHAVRGTSGANPSTTVFRLTERIKAQASAH